MLIQGIKIGANVMVGAGSVVISDIPDGVTVVGSRRVLSLNNERFVLNTLFALALLLLEEASSVENVLVSNRVNYWTGKRCGHFEDEFAQWAGVECCVALTKALWHWKRH